MSRVGDLNRDGPDDILIGTEGKKAYVIFGKPFFNRSIDSFNLDGNNGFEILKTCVSCLGTPLIKIGYVGDFNQDGYADIAGGPNSYEIIETDDFYYSAAYTGASLIYGNIGSNTIIAYSPSPSPSPTPFTAPEYRPEMTLLAVSSYLSQLVPIGIYSISIVSGHIFLLRRSLSAEPYPSFKSWLYLQCFEFIRREGAFIFCLEEWLAGHSTGIFHGQATNIHMDNFIKFITVAVEFFLLDSFLQAISLGCSAYLERNQTTFYKKFILNIPNVFLERIVPDLFAIYYGLWLGTAEVDFLFYKGPLINRALSSLVFSTCLQSARYISSYLLLALFKYLKKLWKNSHQNKTIVSEEFEQNVSVPLLKNKINYDMENNSYATSFKRTIYWSGAAIISTSIPIVATEILFPLISRELEDEITPYYLHTDCSKRYLFAATNILGATGASIGLTTVAIVSVVIALVGIPIAMRFAPEKTLEDIVIDDDADGFELAKNKLLEAIAALDTDAKDPELSYKTILLYLQKAAIENNPRVYTYLGLMYESGCLGTPVSVPAALFFYEKAPKQFALNQAMMAVCYLKGLKGLVACARTAADWFERASTPAEKAANNFSLSDLPILQHAALQPTGIAASLILALAYGEGLFPNIERDDDEAEKWYERFYDIADARTLYHLALLFEEGQWLSPNRQKNLFALGLAADRGLVEAMYRLGTLYRDGIEVDKDYAAAINYFRMACVHHSTAAHYGLARMYEEGWGLDIDLEEANRLKALADGIKVSPYSDILAEPLPRLGWFNRLWFYLQLSTGPEFPPSLQSQGVDCAFALSDWQADRADRLSIRKHEIVYVLNQQGDWWHCENLFHQDGMVPSNFLKLLVKRNLLNKQLQKQLSGEAIEIPENSIQVKKVLGQGNSAMVYLGFWKKKGLNVAVKEFSFRASCSDEEKESFYRELTILKKLRHPNIVELYAYTVTENESILPNLVMEYMNKGSLWDFVGGRGKNEPFVLSWQERYSITLNVANGLDYLHSKKVTHCDLKSLNVLMCDYSGQGFFAKLADFGESTLCEVEGKAKTYRTLHQHGTPQWMAPEVLCPPSGIRRYNETTDIYSFGVIIWELMTGEEPFGDFAEGSFLLQIQNYVGERGKRLEIPSGIPPVFRELIECCWHQDPQDRANTTRILEMLEQAILLETQMAPNAFLNDGSEEEIIVVLSDNEDSKGKEEAIEMVGNAEEKVVLSKNRNRFWTKDYGATRNASSEKRHTLSLN